MAEHSVTSSTRSLGQLLRMSCVQQLAKGTRTLGLNILVNAIAATLWVLVQCSQLVVLIQLRMVVP